MTIYVHLNSKGHLKSYLGQPDIGQGIDYAQWQFDKYKVDGDTFAEVTTDQYAKLSEDSRYRVACQQAAKRMELKAKYPKMYKTA